MVTIGFDGLVVEWCVMARCDKPSSWREIYITYGIIDMEAFVSTVNPCTLYTKV